MEQATLTLFGRPFLVLGEASVDFLPERRFQVLALLAVRNDWVHRDELASLFWPEQPDAAARSNVRKVLFRIRESLPSVATESRGADVRWLVDSDAQRLLLASAAQRWEEVAGLYRGPLLAGIDDTGAPGFADWLDRERRRYFEHARTALLSLIEKAGATRDHCRSRDLAARLLEHDPLDETALTAWCDAQTALGAHDDVVRRYRQFTQQIADELGVEPSDRLRCAAAAWHAAPAAAAPSPAAALDRFIGRRQEVAELRALLGRPECRLLAIVGPGGVGKSRLLREALPELERQLALPALWLPLEHLRGVEEIPARLATLLRASPPQHGSVAEQLAALLGDAPRLLALDNAEHLADLGPLLVTVASAVPTLRIALTTRERLRVSGEWVLPLAGLPVPDADSRDAEAALAFDAVQLFTERARQVHHSLTSAEIGDVVDIVQRVDGLPLAIELAAAWTRLLPPREIADELARSLDLLAAADGRTSVRAVIERSWQLLASREREVLTALSVFVGGFTAAMARRVCDAPLPVLSALLDKSLLNSEPAGRLSMHPLVHHVMRERGSRDPSGSALQSRHCESYASWLQDLSPRTTTTPRETARVIEQEQANCRMALQFASAAGNARLVRPMTLTMMQALTAQSRFREGTEFFVETLALAASNAGCRAPLLYALATLQYRQGNLNDAERFSRQGLLAARRAHDRSTLYRCLNILALTSNNRGDHLQALKYFEPAVRRLRRQSDPRALAPFLTGLGIALRNLGRLDEAAAIYDEALALDRARGNLVGALGVLNNLGNLHRSLRNFPRALQYFDEGLALAQKHGTAYQRTFLLLNRGLTLFELDDLTQSALVLEKVLDECQSEPQAQAQVSAHLGLARIAVRQGDFEQAQGHFANAGRLAHGSAMSLAETMIDLAEARVALGQRLEAAVLLLWAADRPANHTDLRRAAELLEGLALTEAERSACATRATTYSESQLLAALESQRLRPTLSTAVAPIA